MQAETGDSRSGALTPLHRRASTVALHRINDTSRWRTPVDERSVQQLQHCSRQCSAALAADASRRAAQ